MLQVQEINMDELFVPTPKKNRKKRVTIFVAKDHHSRGGPSKMYSFDSALSREAIDTICKLEDAREERKRLEIHSRLEGILNKVREVRVEGFFFFFSL